MRKILLVVAATITGLVVANTDANALTCSSPITCTNGNVAAATVLTGSTTQYGVAVGSTSQAVAFVTPDASTTKYLKSGGSSANPTWSSIATGDLPSTVLIEGDEGAGLAVSGGVLNVASTEANFLTDGGTTDLTCGGSAQGKMQVMDSGVLQYCDGATTSVRQYAALANSSGYATAALAVRSATTTIDLSSATAPSSGQCLKATGASAATWQSCISGSGTDHIYTVSETKILQGSTTVYMGMNGVVSTTEADAAVPVVGTAASSYGRLRCRANTATNGTGIAITLGVAPNSSGNCGVFSYTSKPTVTVTTTTKVADTSNTATANEDECIVYKLVPGSTTVDVFVQCAIERS